MKTYHVTLSRSSRDDLIADMHYYIVREVYDEDEARSLALRRARADYPGREFAPETCKDATPKYR